MLMLLLLLLSIAFSIGAIRARHLLTSAIWLAGVSALVSIVFYLFEARQVAVIELSVGAGLVTILFIFAISIAGDDPIEKRTVIPWPMLIGLSILFVLLLGWYILPPAFQPISENEIGGGLNDMVWNQRGLDILVQVVLIFSGVLGLLGLLAEAKPPLDGSAAEEIAAERDRELQAMEGQFVRSEERSK
jgi:NADH:ubiquinone oxidoreductase subunit 6 (subunit J)